MKFESLITSVGVAALDNILAEVDERQGWTEPAKNSRDALRIAGFAGGILGYGFKIAEKYTTPLLIASIPLAADVLRRCVKTYVLKKETVKLVSTSTPVVVSATTPRPQVVAPPIPGRRPAVFY